MTEEIETAKRRESTLSDFLTALAAMDFGEKAPEVHEVARRLAALIEDLTNEEAAGVADISAVMMMTSMALLCTSPLSTEDQGVFFFERSVEAAHLIAMIPSAEPG